MPVLTAACAALGTMVVSGRQTAGKTREASKRKQTSIYLKYLDPLRLAAENLAWKLHAIEEKIEQNQPGSGGLGWMLHTFHCVKEPQEILHRAPSPTEFAFWCNGEGYFAASTIYVAAVYFLHARRIRREYLEDKELVGKLEAVRIAFGHEYGVYITLQDSIGDYVRADDGSEIGYRNFCTKMSREEERLWLVNLLDYYREIDKKLKLQRLGISQSLAELVDYLGARTGTSPRLPPRSPATK